MSTGNSACGQPEGLLPVPDAVSRATSAAGPLAALGREGRAELLEAMAARLLERREELTATARRETFLAEDALAAEVVRTADQLRLFAEVLREGSYLEATVDTAAPGGDDADLIRRWLVPLGPVAVFGASNFPFAYGVAGGDTASALAAGCPVIAKEHPSHPDTCRLVLSALREAAERAGTTADVVTMVSGFEAGAALVQAPPVHAVGFTGSVAGGRALFDLCAARPEPIPFYGELGSVNPVVVLPSAGSARPAGIVAALEASLLVRGGQVCTKGGLIFVPDQCADVVDGLRDRLAAAPEPVLLSPSIRQAYLAGTAERAALPGCEVLFTRNVSGDTGGSPVPPLLLSTDVETLLDPGHRSLLTECFGPYAVVVRYRDTAELARALAALPASLVCAVHADPEDTSAVRDLLPLLAAGSGRVVWNGPTAGLRVGWATHHGGGYPASTASGTTSVGAAAIKRWLRPSSLQGLPAELLPEELRCGPGGSDCPVPLRFDGRLLTTDTGARGAGA
ncbi:aldehyde dehydrogenase family protein [Streptomyces sp. TP-A0874]|uniref:aldehyde dehydrogenase family protein n=1 Tax=Streptomyces sp. TP-A0874 TaxID=549819 RepID=UPI000852F996|nr:aldehyde dehydrogenase family protein [Streptomyces sp. TP-A0874]